jgi:Iap family predicted aminopeptidase
VKRLLLCIALACIALLVVPVAAQAAAPMLDQAIDQLTAQGYAEGIETTLNSYGTSPLGFRFAGSPSDNAAAKYLAAEMRAMGLVNVRLEPVPIDVWDFRGASVTVAGRTMTCSTWGGTRGTPMSGLTGDVVYVHKGSAADFEAAGDVRGKIVLVDFYSDWWWVNLPGSEASLRGAKAMILTFSWGDPAYYSGYPDALGSFDATYDLSFTPFVYMSQQDGDWLKQQIAAGPVTATVRNDVRIKMADKGGVGYNVVGELPGTAKDGQLVVVMSHHDAYFRAGSDDTAGVASEMLLAKAMKVSSYRPAHSVVFVVTTGEEYGYTNAYYEWIVGSWYQITHTHADWPGRVRAQLNLEGPGDAGGRLYMRASWDISAWAKGIVFANKALAGAGATVDTGIDSWNDQWPFTAAGIPSLYFGTDAPKGYPDVYHTNYDVQSRIDWDFLGQNTKFLFRLAQGIDGGLLPYDFKTRAEDLAANVSRADLQSAGADAATTDRLLDDVAAFRRAASKYETRKASLVGTSAVNVKLMAIAAQINRGFTALSVWDDTIYPHQQVMWDVQYLNGAIGDLQQPVVDAGGALSNLENVALTWNGVYFSYPVYLQELTRHDMDYYRICWGGQGKQVEYVDVMPEYRLIEQGRYAEGLAGLLPIRDREVSDLNARLVNMCEVLENVTAQIVAM